jgi:pimeloyl-ACP methyl ester carboxylesterase
VRGCAGAAAGATWVVDDEVTSEDASYITNQVSAQEDFIVTIGQDKVFTEFNYHDSYFENDPNNPEPWPDQRVAYSEGNIAYVSLSATPRHAGEAHAWVGVEFEWDLGPYAWEEVKNWPVEVTIDFSYHIEAYWATGNGSANAGVHLPILTGWHDFIGYETGQSGSRGDTVSETCITTVEELGGGIIMEAYCQAHSVADGTSTHHSSAEIQISSIKIEFKPVPVLLIHGLLDNPDTWNTMKDRLESEGYIVDSWDYAPGPETATGNINGYAERLRDHIESDYKDVEKLDIVAHSMGGLITRAYLKKKDGNTKIRRFIMIGTPNNGSELCYLIDDDTLEFLERIPISFIQDFAKMAKTELAFKQLTPGSDFLLWLNHDFTHLANTEVHTIAGTDDTWNGLETIQIDDNTALTIEGLGRIYQRIVEPLLVGPDDSVVRVDSAGKVGIIPSEYHATHIGRNPELEHDGIINKVISILGSEPQKYSQDRMVGAASAGSTNISIQYAFTDSDTLSMGEEKKYNIPVSFTDDLSFFVGWDTGDLNLTLTAPTGNLINYTTNTTNITYFYYYNETTGGIQGFDITNPEEGDWEIDLVAQSSPELNYSLITLVNSSLTLSITSEKSIYEPEEHINLSSLLMNGDTPVIDASVEAAIRKPDGYTESLIMYDDGNHSDGQADDGIYGNVFTNTSLLGRYSITAYASNGDFVRESVSMVVWVEQYLDLTLNASDITFSNDAPSPCENVTINATIYNIGEANATNATILFYDGTPANGTAIGEDIVNVSVNATANASVSWIAKAGVHEIYVLISPYNEFLEENYTNNMANKTIVVNIRGDLDGDGILTSTDAVIALQIAVGSRPCDDAMLAAADVSGDDRVTSLDALMILQAAAGRIALCAVCS